MTGAQQARLPTAPDNTDLVDSEQVDELRAGDYKNATRLEDFRPISEAVGGFDLDPCASDKSRLADHNIRNSGGLAADWGQYDKIWLNHPFGEDAGAGDWLAKAVECDAELVVALSKGDPSTDRFHEYIVGEADLICFPDQRMKFGNHKKGLDSGVVFSVFGDYPPELREHFEEIGWVTSGESLSEIPSPDTPDLCDVTRGDRIRVLFSSSVTANGEEVDSTTLLPLCRTFEDGITEIACVQQHDDGTETWYTLSQPVASEASEKPIICRQHTGTNFRHVFVDRIVLPTSIGQSAPPSSHMEVA